MVSSDCILSDEFLLQYKNQQPCWGFNNLGYVVYKRTYARRKENGTLEEWWETVRRCVEAAHEIGANFTKSDAEKLYDHVFNLRCCFSGRALWQLGTPTVQEIGVDSLLNCWVTKVSNIEDFCFILMESMLGGGVGAVVSKEYIFELPKVKHDVRCHLKNTKDADFIVPDSKEGWVDLWRKILHAYLITGQSFTYSTVCIRSNGEPIKRFGGVAPGPRPLVEGTGELCRILEAREGKKLRTQDVCDIICSGGQMVKSGGVRRTALILQGDVDDMAFLHLKRWDLGSIPNYRSNSNNSVITSKFSHLSDRFWKGYEGNGEPYGLINLNNCKKYGRLGESEINGFKLHDSSIIGVNPCAEATCGDKESCNLAELFINNISSKEQMLECAKLLYKVQKAIAAGEYLFDDTNKIVHKNMRLGLGITGVCQKLEVLDEWCDYVYRELRMFDKEYSKQNNWPESIRLTVIKPSGTLGLLGGATPGGHAGYSKYHIRRVRFESNDLIVERLRKAGYHCEAEILFDGSFNHDITVIDFPCSFDDNVMFAPNTTAIQQLDIVKRLQTYWADQAVSVTIYYKAEELPQIKDWLRDNYDEAIKTVSFLLHKDHGFKQAPLEEIDEEMYHKMIKKLKPFDLSDHTETKDLDNLECSSGSCPVR